MQEKRFNNIFPRSLSLTRNGSKITFRAAESQIDAEFMELLRQNKDSIIQSMQSDNYNSINLYPLSQNQKALWFISQVNSDSSSYNIGLAIRINNGINKIILESTLENIIEKLWPLKSRVFTLLDGKDVHQCQIVPDNNKPFIVYKEVDISEDKLIESINTDNNLPFNLETDPLFKTYIYKNLQNGFDYLMFSFHHIICDVISLKQFSKKFLDIYNKSLIESETNNELGRNNYAEFIFEQNRFLNGSDSKDQLNYWKKEISALPPNLEFPTDYPRPKTHQFKGKTIHFNINNELYTRIKNLALQIDVTLNSYLFTVYQILLAEFSKQMSFCIGTPFSARTNTKYSDTFGYLINTLPVCCSLPENDNFNDLLKRNSRKLLNVIENQDIPFPLLVDEIAQRRDLSRTPVFQVLFNFMNKKALGTLAEFLDHNSQNRTYGSLSFSPIKLHDQEGQFDFTMEIIDNDHSLNCSFKYNSDIFSDQTANNLVSNFNQIILNTIENSSYKPNILNQKSENIQLNITGTFTTEPIEKALQFWFKKINLPSDLNFVGFNQVFQQLLNPGSEFNTVANSINVAFIRLEDLFNQNESLKSNSERILKELKKSLLSHAQTNTSGKTIVTFCPPSDRFITDEKFLDVSTQIESETSTLSEDFNNLFIIKTTDFIEEYKLSNYYEPIGETQGNIPYKNNFFACAATLITRKIHSIYNPPLKAIVLDCDNTLWAGVIGEDGINGIEIREQEKKLQEFLIHQYDAGVLLCICSKNNEDDVWEVFDKNPQMILKKEHISFSRINWESKSKNIFSLSKEINIGLDSFVFIDDNPIECEEVRSVLPSVCIIQKRNDSIDIDYITNSWIFDRNKITAEDKKRSLMYQEEAKRISLKSKFKSYTEFLDELNIKIDIHPVTQNEIARISQLTFRTNQFNFTTIRRTESEISALINIPGYQTFSVHLEDKYGDYGIIGAIICFEKEDSLHVDTFLLSCRALGKGVEHKMIAFIGERANGRNKKNIEIHFSNTEKNIVAEKFLDLHFLNNKIGSGSGHIYTLPVELAFSFKFDPSSVQTQIEDSAVKQDIEIKPGIVNRNNLFNDISENFSDIDSIVRKIYGEEKTIESVRRQKKQLNANQIQLDILSIWREVLDNPSIQVTDNFFDVGGKSILIPNIVIRLKNELGLDIDIVDVFQYPTVSSISEFLSPTINENQNSDSTVWNTKTESDDTNDDIAIIGLSGRFPGANNIEEFWQLIKSGKEAITHYSRIELEEKGVIKELLDDPYYVYAAGSIPTADKFDASFFGFTPKEADFMDPQHRVFLESCHEALENAGYSSDNYNGSIGVFGGSGPDNYILKNLFQHEDALRNIGEFQTIINNGKDFLTTHASYKLNLNGPSLDIQTACSTSLVAVHYACNSLRNNETDIALAGGVFIHTPREVGYMFEPGGILSPKGQCRPFDDNADGTVFGEGVGIVVLKRYADAIKDNDTIWGIIKGSAVNNDGSAKVGYMAPGINGQSSVIAKAQKFAGVRPSDISLIEAHGTGTNLGDPVEIKALSNVFRAETQSNEFCAVGSIKANIGHLDAAAGVTGLIKATLALKHQQIPPSINFNQPNPELKITETPFYINTELKSWKIPDNKPRIAGVSSFGIGGTNAHCIIQEATELQSKPSNRKYHIIPVSAKTESALNNIKNNLGSFLINNDCNLPDFSFTLLHGRKRFKYRSAVVCRTQGEAIGKLVDATIKTTVFTKPRIVFLFTGQGSQYNGMTKGLYDEFPIFKEHLDKAFRLAKLDYDLELEDILFSEKYKSEINNTEFTQPALFVVQFAMAKLLQSFGIASDALIGHSIGEITAACISGLLSFEDALKLVIIRGRLMQAQKPGAMLSVQLPADKVKEILPDNLDFALQNAPNFSVVSGDFDAITDFKNKLESEYPDVMISQLNTSHAFHSRMMDPALDEFKNSIADISFNNIDIPFVSNTTGTWANKDTVGNADYWVNHIRSTVNFVDGINTLLEERNTLFVEVGPGVSLTTLLSQFEKDNQKIVSIPTIRHPRKKVDDIEFFFDAISGLWCYGADMLFDNWYDGEKRKRIPLPTYPFERQRHWIDPVVPFSYHVKTKSSNINLQQSENISLSESIEQSDGNPKTLHQRPEVASSYTPPSNETEKKLVRIWQDLLGIDAIGINDDFFELGGHSLLASKLLIRIKNELGVTLKLQNLNSDSLSVKQISELITNNSEVQINAKNNSKFKIVVKKTNEITEDEWSVYIKEFNINFNTNFDKEDFIKKYMITPLGFSFHSFVYVDNNFVGSQSNMVELFDYKTDVIKVACGCDLFIMEQYRKNLTFLFDLWESADSILIEHNVKAYIGNPLPDLLEYHETAQTGFRLISYFPTYILPLTVKVVHPNLGFLDLFYRPILNLIITIRSLNKSPIYKQKKLFKTHEYYSPYDYKTYQEKVGDIKFSWLWTKFTHLKINIINDNFKRKGDLFSAANHLIKKQGKEAEAIAFMTTNKPTLPFIFFQKREMFIGKILSNDINSDDFFNINNWEFSRGFFD